MQFKAGDKVVNEIFGEGEIVYGPFEGDNYFFKNTEGLHYTVTGMWCKPAPRFEVGQKVTFTYSPKGTSFEIMAGPFPDEGESFYVLKDQDGNHDTSFEKYMIPVVE